MGHWLEALPDGTYPNIHVVKEILTTINLLNIDSDNLERSKNVGSIVRKYANGTTGVNSV